MRGRRLFLPTGYDSPGRLMPGDIGDSLNQIPQHCSDSRPQTGTYRSPNLTVYPISVNSIV